MIQKQLEPVMRLLDEQQRDGIIQKILSITTSKNKRAKVSTVVEELETLEAEGYDVDSYFLMLRNFIDKYVLMTV